MKKLVLFVSFMFIASLCFGQNLALNPGFENWTVNGAGGPPDDWSLSSGSMTATQEATTFHGGTYSANVTWTTTSTVYLQQFIDVTAGTNYQFTFWVYDNDPFGRARIAIRWYDSGGSFISGFYGGYSTDSAVWQQLDSGIQEAPVNTTSAHIEIRVYDVSWTGTATVYADDVSFTEVIGNSIDYAYAISGDALEVFYVNDVTSVNAADFELTGSATTTFSTATIDVTNAKLVHLSGASTTMADDNTLDSISDEAKSTYDFYAGITSVAYTNTLNPGGIIDNTHTATFHCIVSANDAYNNVWVSDAAGAYNGVLIFDYTFDTLVDVGDEILFTADRTTYSNLTELEHPELISTISTGNAPYGPTVIDGSDIDETITVDTNPAESWEGQFVKIENFYVDSYSGADYEYRCKWSDAKTDYYFIVGDNVDFQFGTFSLIVGSTYQDIQGVVDWDNSGSFYRINPRDAGDATLPVELSSFTALFANEFVTIQWATASETDVIGFNIYRAHEDNYEDADKVNFELIPGHGTTTQPQDYSFTDETADAYFTTYYYWLEAVNYGGTTDIYGSIQYDPVDVDGDGQLNTIVHSFMDDVFPNPVQVGENITFNFMIGGLEGTMRPVSLNIYDIKGKLVQEVINEDMMVNDYTETWRVNDIANGVYFYQLKTKNYQETKKLLIQ